MNSLQEFWLSLSSLALGLKPTDWIQLALAILTLLAVLVAFLQEKIKQRFRRASLKVTINPEPPDSHKIKMRVTTQLRSYEEDVIYVRLRVQHEKGDSAENVEVLLANCWELTDGEKILKKNFIPLNLKWANRLSEESVIRIPVGLFRFCDLGYLYRAGGEVHFHLDTVVEPNAVGDEAIYPNVLGSGEYEIEIWVGGDNTKVTKKRWRIKIDGKWDERESEMLEKHLVIAEI